MIALFLLLGIALVVVAGALWGEVVVIVLAALLALAVVVGVVSDVARAVRGRRTVYRRWDEWRRG